VYSKSKYYLEGQTNSFRGEYKIIPSQVNSFVNQGFADLPKPIKQKRRREINLLIFFAPLPT
jgi:hypothetical protein